ncbi:hypothetical protein DVH24_017441 [Malus domestica]|uniref:Uncharacterized protein n=1 Tax=Malus domestica TaxID=3750 RepID=A0A498ISF6_MALDO|nr:hypothetical protein DVH24_017441 [Malus domestica]
MAHSVLCKYRSMDGLFGSLIELDTLGDVSYNGFLVAHPGSDPTTSRARLHRSMILSVLGPDHTLMVLFLGTHTRTSQWVTHPEIALAASTLNFGVPIEPEASELLKCLVLGRDVNIHIRPRRSTSLGDVGGLIL